MNAPRSFGTTASWTAREGARLPDDFLQRRVDGVGLAPGTFGEQLDPDGPTLLCFLRHFG